MTRCACGLGPIPWDSHATSNAKHVTSRVCLSFYIHIAVAEEPLTTNQRRQSQVGDLFYQLSLKKGPTAFLSQPRITMAWHWASTSNITVLWA